MVQQKEYLRVCQDVDIGVKQETILAEIAKLPDSYLPDE